MMRFHKAEKETLSDFLFAGRRVSYGLLAASIFVSLTWTSSILAAAETGIRYGISGGIMYAFGLGIPFSLLIIFQLRLRQIMPEAASYTQFIGLRYGQTAKNIYTVYGIVIAVYISIAQAVGVAIVFQDIFGISFKLVAFFVIMIAVAYVCTFGMRGTLYADFLMFLSIFILFAVIALSVTKSMSLDSIYYGILDTVVNPYNVNYNPYALSFMGFKYSFVTSVMAVGSIFLDQGYYTKARAAKNGKTLAKSFLAGGLFAMIPLTIISATVFGNSALALKVDSAQYFRITTDISPYIIKSLLGPSMSILFAIMILLVGVSTCNNCIIGVFSIFAADTYRSAINPGASQRDCLIFGRTATLCIGVLCALVAIALDGISLLKIITFCGVFFAAPCGALILGAFITRISGFAAVCSVFIGLLAGTLSWLILPDPETDWVIGTVLSFSLPILFLLAASRANKAPFDFAELRRQE